MSPSATPAPNPVPVPDPEPPSLRQWVRDHDESWIFVVVYLGLAVGLSVFVSLFWLVLVAGLHFVLELFRQRFYRAHRKSVVLHALWEVKLDIGLVLLALMLVLYIEVVLGILGIQSAARAAAVSRAGARVGTRAAAWERNLRTFLLTVDEMIRVGHAGVMLRRKRREDLARKRKEGAEEGAEEGADGGTPAPDGPPDAAGALERADAAGRVEGAGSEEAGDAQGADGAPLEASPGRVAPESAGAGVAPRPATEAGAGAEAAVEASAEAEADPGPKADPRAVADPGAGTGTPADGEPGDGDGDPAEEAAPPTTRRRSSELGELPPPPPVPDDPGRGPQFATPRGRARPVPRPDAWAGRWKLGDRIGVALVVIGVLLIGAAPYLTDHDWRSAGAALVEELRPFPGGSDDE